VFANDSQYNNICKKKHASISKSMSSKLWLVSSCFHI
jgi:hypothetical protein